MRKSLYLAVAILFLSCNALFAQAGLLGEEEDAVETGMSDPGPGIYTEHMSEERMARERQEDEGSDNTLDRLIFHVGELEPIASTPKLNIGDQAPDFKLPAVSSVLRTTYGLSEYKGKKNVVLSFIPAAWTPICSSQWPGYCDAKKMFQENDAVLLGIATDNIPTLHAWTTAMDNVWFPVLSDFWPHGRVASLYGVLRSDGVSERALFVIDKKGVIRFTKVYDINTMPNTEELKDILKAL